MSFLHRLSQEASNAVMDVYGNVFLGDDAGKSARLTLIVKPNSRSDHKLSLGMTFLEVNGRAYVQSVIPGSQAAQNGVMPQDAVQFATIFQKEWMSHGKESSSLATQFALRAESRGTRLSYDQLRSLLSEAVDPAELAFISPPTHKPSTWKGPPIPSSVNICVSDTDSQVYVNSSGRPSSPVMADTPLPVIFVFRRTRQRKSMSHMNMVLPSFRLDDECDFASSLVKRLAPTADMEIPPPDTWEELVHDGTDWLLGSGSMLPPKVSASNNPFTSNVRDDHAIPMDDFEKERAKKLANLRSKMAAEAIQIDRTDDVEAATIRGMIQKAVGLAFVRASKVVLGVSIHGGCGIVISRLSDGTWSAPSAIGTWGLGLGIQFGLEVAEYIFILQTQAALDHFRNGGSFTIGGNIGAAVAGMGREAYGAASAAGTCGSNNAMEDDVYNDNDSFEHNAKVQSAGIAPIVAYAKSQGLYIGVSLEGSRIFARDDINARTYKFTCGRDVSAHDVLSGKVPTPPEAEDLYAALHSVEFTHEMSCLPRPPEILREDSPNVWHFDRSTLYDSKSDAFNFLASMSKANLVACEAFELQFKKFMYGGVSVQRLLPHSESRSGRTGKERRTLWLMLPETGSLRLGFVSKLSDGEGAVSNKSSTLWARRDDPSKTSAMGDDLVTVESEEVTLDSALFTDKDGASTIGQIRTGNVQLSNKHSVALTDITILSHDPLVPIKFNPDDQTEHLRVISIQDVSGTSLLFLANNFREAELLVCGLKLLLERETLRLGVRGGLPISTLGGRTLEGSMSPTAARGFRDQPSTSSPGPRRQKGKKSSRSTASGYSSSEGGDPADHSLDGVMNGSYLPEGRQSWGRVPGRDYMRGQAASTEMNHNKGVEDGEQGVPHYVHGQLLTRDIVKNARLPLPLPFCRVLLLDSASPVMSRWEQDRGDMKFEHTAWTFPPATPRELERHDSEHQLIATGSMCGAHRTTSFDRMRHGSWVRLSETQIVDADDSEKLALTVTERMPRRGFSIKVRILLRALQEKTSEATIFVEIRPVGKDMSNQAAVHKAFQLVLHEAKNRYGTSGSGLMAGFFTVIDNMGNSSGRGSSSTEKMARPFPRTGPNGEEQISESNESLQKRRKNKASGLVSFEDMLKTGRHSPEMIQHERPATPSMRRQIPEPDPSKRLAAKAKALPSSSDFDEPVLEPEPVMIEVKPLPKIRLSLMPSPREEDEENDSSYSPTQTSKSKKKKSNSKRKTNSTWRKSGRYKV